MKYIKKAKVIEATQWFKNGDHPLDGNSNKEGKVVRYFNHPDIDKNSICDICKNIIHRHGWVDAFELRHRVCPGDWIVTNSKGNYYLIAGIIFKELYEPVEE